MKEEKIIKWLMDEYYVSTEIERYQYGNGSNFEEVLAEYKKFEQENKTKMTEQEATEGIKRLNLKNKHLRDPNKTRSFCGLRRTGKPMKQIKYKEFNMVRTNCVDCIIELRDHLNNLIENHSDIYQGPLVYQETGGMKIYKPIDLLNISEVQLKIQREACEAWFDNIDELLFCSNGSDCEGNHKTHHENMRWTYEGEEEYEHIIDIELTWNITVKESYKI